MAGEEGVSSRVVELSGCLWFFLSCVYVCDTCFSLNS